MTTQPPIELSRLDEIYLALVRLQPSDSFRAANQDIYARLRDAVAEDWQWDAEKIQTHFEELASQLWNKEKDRQISAIAAMGGVDAEGRFCRPFDSVAPGSDSPAGLITSTPSSNQPCEIPSHIEIHTALEISRILATEPHHKQLDALLAAFRPYLRTSEPEEKHCVDCCCARAWKALGISQYTGKSIAEHITELRTSPKPVSVSLKKLRTMTFQHGGHPAVMLDDVEGELEAAGVKYVD